MTLQQKKIDVFHALHHAQSPLILANVWDAGGAKVAAKSGAKAIATSSWAALSH